MEMKHLLTFGFLLVCCLLEVSSRPNNESTKLDLPIDETEETSPVKVERSITFTNDPVTAPHNVNTQEIIQKIQAINEALKKPHKQQLNYNKPQKTAESYAIDREMLEKLQQIIASEQTKIHSVRPKQYENNYLTEESNENRQEYSKALQMFPNVYNQPSTSPIPYPYIMNVPVVVMPNNNNLKNTFNDINSIQTRQEQLSPFPAFPSFPTNFQWPFQLQWPFGKIFPLILKDPLIGLYQGGGWNNFIEYGQDADVCARKQKSIKSETQNNDIETDELLKAMAVLKDNVLLRNVAPQESDDPTGPVTSTNTRQKRALKKRTVANNAPDQQIETARKVEKIYVAKPVVTRKPPKKIYIEEELHDTKNSVDDGDLRFQFGHFDWFGNKKPVAPSPGFFINKLRVRKGGVAIAGPGGVATAGKGGTAIVGPGGLAYTQPGGLAVAGPAARVFALSSATDLNTVVSQLRELNATSGPPIQPIREGKLVATGPVIYYHPNEQT